MLRIAVSEFPRPRPDVHGPPSPAGFGISRVLGSAGSYANRRKQRGVVSLSHAIASLKAPISVLTFSFRRKRSEKWGTRHLSTSDC